MLCASAGSLRGDDVQSWSALMLKHPVGENWTATWRVEPRFTNDVSRLGTVFTRASLARKWNDSTTLTMDYTHIEFDKYDATRGENRFYQQNWLGAGFTSRFRVLPRWDFTSRNNVHLRWIEAGNSPNLRTRHYVEMAWRAENSRYLKGVYTGNEFFVEWANKATRENRFTPLGVRVKTSPRTAMSFFYMIRSTKPGGNWTHAHVLGSYLTYSL